MVAKNSSERWIISILAAIQVMHILDFVVMMPLGPQFMRVFAISPAGFSTLVSAYTFSAAIIGFLGSLWADQFDRKKFLLFNFLGFILGTLFCAMATDYISLLIGRIIAGAFGGVLNACILSLVSDLIPFERRGRAMGAIMSAFSIASVLGVPAGLYLANLFNWQATFYAISLVAIVFFILTIKIIPNVPSLKIKTNFSTNLKAFKKIVIKKEYLECFTLTGTLGFGVFMVVPFISPYLVSNVKLLEKDLPLIYLVGGACTIISARTIGKLCDTFGNYRIFSFLALISLVPIFTLTNLPIVPLPFILITTSFFMMFVSGRFIPTMTLISAVVKPAERGTFMGLENSFRQLAAGCASQIGGLIIIHNNNGLQNYNWVGYITMLSSLIALYLARKLALKHKLK